MLPKFAHVERVNLHEYTALARRLMQVSALSRLAIRSYLAKDVKLEKGYCLHQNLRSIGD